MAVGATDVEASAVAATIHRYIEAVEGKDLDRQLAWATGLWDWGQTTAGETATVPVRCTWVLEHRDADWVIVHWHKSVGVA